MTQTAGHPLQELEKVVIRFAGDSGDGLRLVAAGERLGPGDLGELLSSGTTWQT